MYKLKSITNTNNKDTFYANFNLYQYTSKYDDTFIKTRNNKLKLFYDFNTGLNAYTQETQKAEAIFYNNTITNADLKNKFICILNSKNKQQTKITSLLKQKGAKGIIRILEDNKSFPGNIALQKRLKEQLNSKKYFLNFTECNNFISFNMSKSSAAMLFDMQLKSFNNELKRYKKNKKTKILNKTTSFSYNLPAKTDTIEVKNIIGIIPGTDLKNEVIAITAHYDHLGKNKKVYFPGADDNGSGISVLLETAKILSKYYQKGISPRRTIAFIAFTGEEQNLLGSKYLLENDSIIDVNKIVANINIDMVGRGSSHHKESPNQLYILGRNFDTNILELSDSINNIYSYLTLDYKYTIDDPKKYFEKSDQFSFIQKDIPSVFYFGGTHKDLHTPKDTYGKINFNRLKKVTLLTFRTLWAAANNDKL
ncbi:MAG: M28 family peptidase [Bacteroidota bacterium]|nr:M28 family peptidase [Bacteroidota bacterium]